MATGLATSLSKRAGNDDVGQAHAPRSSLKPVVDVILGHGH